MAQPQAWVYIPEESRKNGTGLGTSGPESLGCTALANLVRTGGKAGTGLFLAAFVGSSQREGPMATMVANCFFAPGKVNLQLRIQKALEILEKQGPDVRTIVFANTPE
ncbi:unnamed protein product, partial [Symbiodinium necroappetens]